MFNDCMHDGTHTYPGLWEDMVVSQNDNWSRIKAPGW